MLVNVIVPRYPLAVFPNASTSRTVNVPAAPATDGFGNPVTWTVLAVAGFTMIPLWVPVRKFAASVAVIDWVPAVRSVAPLVNVCAPASVAVNEIGRAHV